jgi:hypothetical protein
MSTHILKIKYEEDVKSVALCEGMDVNELQSLLQAIFKIPVSIVGFLVDVSETNSIFKYQKF